MDSMEKKVTEVVAALIWDEDRFLICRRPPHKARGLLWEFAGGKVEPGETKEQALIRECREELAVTLSVNTVFMEVDHRYPDITVHLTLFNAAIREGTPQMLEHSDLRWITPEEIPHYDFCPADEEILKRLSAAHTLTVLCPGGPPSGRFAKVLEAALQGRRARFSRLEELPGARHILFAVQLDGSGLHPGLYRLLAYLRTHPGCLRGCVGGVLIDGPGALYTKSAARELVLAANLAGCAFPGRPLVEAVEDLQNFTVQAKNAGCSLAEAYRLAAAELARRVLAFSPPRRERPRLLVLHASSRATSNTLALWGLCRERLEAACEVREIGLRNGTLEDCAGCPYTACLHFGEQGDCFYGGVMVQEVYPAIREADGVVLLCPNYNDALPANLTAAVNRLTALYRAAPFENTAVFALVVSGYSGGDIVASQVISAMNMNKGFWLPPEFCLLETANDPGTAVRLPGIAERTEAFAQGLLRSLRA